MSIEMPPEPLPALEEIPAIVEPAVEQAAGRRRGGAKRGRGIAALLVSFITQALAQFVTLGLITRLAGPEEAGIWAYASSFRDPFLAFMDFGTTRLLVAEIARRREDSDRLLSNALTLGFMVGLPVLAIMMIAANLGVLELSPIIIYGIYWKGLTGLLFTTTASFRSAFRAFNRFEYEAISNIIATIILIVATFLVLYLEFPFLWVFVSLAFAQAAALAYSYLVYNRRFGKAKLAFERPIMGQILNKTWAFTLVGLLSRAFTRVDVLILTFFRGIAAAGYYALATTIFYQLNSIAQLLTTAILPSMANAFVKRPDKVGKQLDATVRLQTLAALPATALGVVLASQLIRLLYGTGYEESAFIFQLLVSVTALRFLNQTLGTVLTAADKQNQRAFTLGIVVIFNVVGNFILIPNWERWGSFGVTAGVDPGVIAATVTAILSEILLFILTYAVIPRQIRSDIQWTTLVRPTLATLALVPLLYVIRDWTILVVLPLGLLAFGLSLLLFRSFSQSESQAIATLIRRLKMIPGPLRKGLSAVVLSRANNSFAGISL